MPGLQISSAMRSDVGRVRAVNQDAILTCKEGRFFALADGMGGLRDGAWAATEVLRLFAEMPYPADADEIASALEERLVRANTLVHDHARHAGEPTGTTLVAVCLADDVVHGIWVGDSRLYRWRATGMDMLSHDHSMVQAMVDRGSLDPADQADHPLGHVLFRAVGIAPETSPGYVCERLRPGDRLLLCSDGLTRVVDPVAIGRLLAGDDAVTMATALIDAALAAGAPDNVSVIVIVIEGNDRA